MKCDKTITKYLELDDYSIIPLSVRFHLLFCTKCSEEVAMLNSALNEIRVFNPFPMKRDMTYQIMSKINPPGLAYERKISTFNWVSAGLVILASIFLVSYSESLSWLKGQFGKNLEVPLNIVLGITISAYLIAFIGSHVEEFKKNIAIFNIFKKKIP